MIYHLYANKVNVGDRLSALGIQRYIYPNKAVELYWTDGEKEKTATILKNIAHNDMLIIGGGGLLKDFFLPMWESIIHNYNGYKIILWGIGDCVVKNIDYTGLSNKIYSEIAQISTKIYVRDFSTQARFLTNGARAHVVGCPSTKVVRDWKKFKPRYLLHVVHTGLIKNTLPLWRSNSIELSKYMGMKYVEINHIFPKDKKKHLLKWLLLRLYYQNAGLIISSRLHGLVIGSAIGIPLIAISNDYKIDAYWRGTLGASNLLNPYEYNHIFDIVRYGSFDPPKVLLDKVDELININKQVSIDVSSLLN